MISNSSCVNDLIDLEKLTPKHLLFSDLMKLHSIFFVMNKVSDLEEITKEICAQSFPSVSRA